VSTDKKAASAGGGASAANGASALGPAVSNPMLIKRREELSREIAELQWDLGGIAYEMASRDHFRLDVLSRKAAELQKVDAELGQIERVLKMDESGAAGTCPSCGSLQARGAVFCWQCGKQLAEPASPSKAKAVDPSKAGSGPITAEGSGSGPSSADPSRANRA
jgi:hypothetical protein